MTVEERARLTSGSASWRWSRSLHDQHERRLSDENQRESTMLAALRRMEGDPAIDVEGLKKLGDEMKQRFVATMTEFTARTERLKALHAETIATIERLAEPA